MRALEALQTPPRDLPARPSSPRSGSPAPAAPVFRSLDPLHILQPAKKVAALAFASGEVSVAVCTRSDATWPDGAVRDAWYIVSRGAMALADMEAPTVTQRSSTITPELRHKLVALPLRGARVVRHGPAPAGPGGAPVERHRLRLVARGPRAALPRRAPGAAAFKH